MRVFLAAKFASDIKTRMAKEMVTYRELGKEIDVQFNSISLYTKEKREPGLINYIKICEWLGKPFEYYIQEIKPGTGY